MQILAKIAEVIKERERQPQEGSYTNYLLTRGVDKICKKVGEEAAETIIAAKNDDQRELSNELADLFYHLLVLMHQQQVSLEDVEAVLQQRFSGPD